jgi:hypothetical protein
MQEIIFCLPGMKIDLAKSMPKHFFIYNSAWHDLCFAN